MTKFARRAFIRTQLRYRSARLVFVTGKTIPLPTSRCFVLAAYQFFTNNLLNARITFADDNTEKRK
jgi:hypothetical protein